MLVWMLVLSKVASEVVDFAAGFLLLCGYCTAPDAGSLLDQPLPPLPSPLIEAPRPNPR